MLYVMRERYCHLWYKYPKTQTSEILLVFDDFFRKLLLLVLIKTLYTGQEAELLRERESRAEIKIHLSHRISAPCLLYRRGRYVNRSFPAYALASRIQGRHCFFFFYYCSLELRTALQRVDTSSEGYVMICMFWSWRMNIRCWAGCLA